MNIPPGLSYIFPVLLLCSLSSLVAFAILNRSREYLQVAAPTWLLVAAASLARPIYILLSNLYRNQHNRRSAERRGAVLPPVVYDKWPGGLSIIAAMVKSFKTGYPGDVFLEWCEQYGNTYRLNIVSENRMFTIEPDHVKAILATQFDNFEKGATVFYQFQSFLGTGVFNSDGDMWKFHRTITRPFFSKERISDFDVFERHAEDAIHQARDRLADGYPIDFQDLVSRFTLDSATEFLFGNAVQSLSAGLPYPESSPLANSPSFLNHRSNTFVNAFVAGQTLITLRSRYGPSWPLIEFWKDNVKPRRMVIDKFIDPILSEALAKKKTVKDATEGDVKGTGNAETLLDDLVNHTQDIQILKDELLNLLVAARDTTASTLTFAMYMMTQHPEVTRRLREEILNKAGNSRPTFEQLRDMKYLRAFINETLRLYPPVPFDYRFAKEATVLPSKTPGSKPIYVPANTKCLYSVMFIHRRTDLWGPDALEFNPQRFLDERLQKYLIPNPYIFLPFNAGPRICLGQQFAYHEVSFFLVRLLQTFSRFEFAEDAQPESSRPPASWSGCGGTKGRDKIWPASHLTMYVKGGLWVRMEEAKSGEVA